MCLTYIYSQFLVNPLGERILSPLLVLFYSSVGANYMIEWFSIKAVRSYSRYKKFVCLIILRILCVLDDYVVKPNLGIT